MENRKNRPAYLQDGYSLALLVFLIVEGVLAGLGLISLVVELVMSFSRGNFLVSLLSAAASGVGMVLSVMIARGAVRLRRGDYYGAETMRSAWSVRRVLLIIAAVIIGIGGLISLARAPLAGLLILVLEGGVLAIALKYVSDVISVLDTVSMDVRSGQKSFDGADNRISGICIISAVLTLGGTVALLVLPERIYTYRSVLYNWGPVIPFFLWLATARLIVTIACNRMFKIEHDPTKAQKAASSPLADLVGGLDVFGMIFLCWLGLQNLENFTAYSGEPLTLITLCLRFASFIALGFALISRLRDKMIAVGGALAAAVGLYNLFRGLFEGWIASNIKYSGIFAGLADIIYLVTLPLFFIGVTCAAVMALKNREVPRSLRTILIVLAGVIGFSDLLGAFRYLFAYGSYSMYYTVSNIITLCGPETVGMLALAFAVGRKPSVPDARPVEEKEGVE